MNPSQRWGSCGVCLGLRISEALGLRWRDIDWLQSRVTIRRGVVMQREGECKTSESAKKLIFAPELINRLKVWKQATQFGNASDWIFASPVQLGRLPYSYTGTRQELVQTGCGNRPCRHAFVSAHLESLAEFCGNNPRGNEAIDAAFNNCHEHGWPGRGDRR